MYVRGYRPLCSSCHKTWLDTSQEKCQLYVRSFFEKEAVSFENGLLTLQIVRFLFSMPCSLYQPHPFYCTGGTAHARAKSVYYRNGSSSREIFEV